MPNLYQRSDMTVREATEDEVNGETLSSGGFILVHLTDEPQGWMQAENPCDLSEWA